MYKYEKTHNKEQHWSHFASTVNAEVQKLLENGIIEKSFSPYNSPIPK